MAVLEIFGNIFCSARLDTFDWSYNLEITLTFG